MAKPHFAQDPYSRWFSVINTCDKTRKKILCSLKPMSSFARDRNSAACPYSRVKLRLNFNKMTLSSSGSQRTEWVEINIGKYHTGERLSFPAGMYSMRIVNEDVKWTAEGNTWCDKFILECENSTEIKLCERSQHWKEGLISSSEKEPPNLLLHPGIPFTNHKITNVTLAIRLKWKSPPLEEEHVDFY